MQQPNNRLLYPDDFDRGSRMTAPAILAELKYEARQTTQPHSSERLTSIDSRIPYHLHKRKRENKRRKREKAKRRREKQRKARKRERESAFELMKKEVYCFVVI